MAVEQTTLVSLAVLSLALPALGCGKVLGIEEKQLTGTPSVECPLLADEGPAVRIMNAVPGSPTLDLCHKVAGKGTFGRTWFGSHSKQCGEGVSYTQFTRDLAISVGTYDFKLVSAGSGCEADGVEANGVEIVDGASVTLMAYGPDWATARISTLPNLTAPTKTQPIRFVHALNNADLLSAGMMSRTVEKAIGTVLFENVEFGHAAGKSEGLLGIDDFGYVKLGSNSVPVEGLGFGVRQGNTDSVILIAPIPMEPAHAYTVFAVGSLGVTGVRPKIWSCDERAHEGLFLKCGNPDSISMEVFNPNLTDAFTPRVAERTDAAIDAILAESADLLCLTELYDPRVRERLRNGSGADSGQRLFSDDIPAERTTSLVMRADGSTPTYPALACPTDLAKNLSDWFDCAKSQPECIATSPNAPGETFLKWPGEAALNCMLVCGEFVTDTMLAELKPGGRAEAGSCYWCAITHLASYESLEHTLERCTTEVPEAERRHMAFGGTSGLAVFSRNLTLGEPTLVHLPSSGWQRATMRVPVTARNGAQFDFWCTSVRFPNDEQVLLYAGPYGTWGSQGNAEEQAFEVYNAVSAIDAQAHDGSGVPTVVAIEAYSGRGFEDANGIPIVYPFIPDIYDLMGNRWTELFAQNYTPACTFCGDNPLNGLEETYRFWTAHLFGIGIGSDAVESTQRTFTEPTATITDASAGTTTKVPVSQFYGIRSVVRLTQ